jgi:hypothetical protein
MEQIMRYWGDKSDEISSTYSGNFAKCWEVDV